MHLSENLEKLIQGFSRFPGIGRKTAQRIAWYILSQDKDFAFQLADSIRTAVEKFTTCKICNMLSEADPCQICTSSDRDVDVLCIVESSADIQIIENMNEFRGRYFVLGHLLSPIDGYGPDEINAHLLLQRINNLKPQEVVLALKPSAEGEATIHYIWELLKEKNIAVTRLSTGLPFGGDLEYSSSSTLCNAWNRRYSV